MVKTLSLLSIQEYGLSQARRFQQLQLNLSFLELSFLKLSYQCILCLD